MRPRTFAAALVAAATMTTAASAETSPIVFVLIDVNRSGTIEIEEWLDLKERLFDALDQNSDGVVNDAELASAEQRVRDAIADRVVKSIRNPGARERRATRVLESMDVNGDGLISKGEVLNGQQPLFTRADTNADERVTVEEWRRERSAAKRD